MRLKSEQQASKPRTSSGTSPLLQTPAGALPVTKVTKGSNAHKRQLTYVTTRPNSESFLIYLAVFAGRNRYKWETGTTHSTPGQGSPDKRPGNSELPTLAKAFDENVRFLRKNIEEHRGTLEEHSRNTRGTTAPQSRELLIFYN